MLILMFIPTVVSDKIYGNDMDETSRKELMLRIDGITDENEE